MNELVIKENVTIENKELARISNGIAKAVGKVQESLAKICFMFSEIKERELWNGQFSSFEDYGKEVFGLGKSIIYRYARIGKNFVTCETIGKSKTKVYRIEVYGEKFRNVTQIGRLLPYEDEEVEQAIKDEIINGQMSANQIESAMRSHFGEEQEQEQEQEEQEQEQEEQEQEQEEQEQEQEEQEHEQEQDFITAIFAHTNDTLSVYMDITKKYNGAAITEQQGIALEGALKALADLKVAFNEY